MIPTRNDSSRWPSPNSPSPSDHSSRQARHTRTPSTQQRRVKPFPKSAAGRRTVPLPPWLVEIIREHRETYPLGENDLVFPNAVGKPLRRTLFRTRVWRPSLVRAGMLGALTIVDDDTVRAGWTDATGATLAKEFPTEREAVL
ncbi:MAG: hypothetical protein ACRDQY_04760, partial [Pseudonocardiaceae bacterium]